MGEPVPDPQKVSTGSTLATPGTPVVIGTANPLTVPAFRLLWTNALTFFLVANALRYLYGWVVLDGLGLSEAWQGLIVFILGVPAFFLLAPAGVWADRLDPKKFLISTQAVLTIVMVLTAIGMGQGAGSRALLIVSALAAGAASSMGGPVRSALIPAVLAENQLYKGIALNGIAVTVSLVLGAVAVQAFGDRFGFDGAFYYMAGLLLIGLIALWRFTSPGPAGQEGDGVDMGAALREGMVFLWDSHGIRALFGLLSISGLLMMPVMMVLSQAHIKQELGRTAGDAAPMFALMGLGIAASSVYILGKGEMKNKAIFLMRSMLAACALLILMGLTTAYWQMLVLAALIGVCGGIFFNMNQGLIQSNTPANVMGRVMSVYSLIQVGLLPIGALLLGLVAAAIGTGVTMVAASALALVIISVVYVTSDSVHLID